MGTLARFVQRRFMSLCPAGWTCTSECQLLAPGLAQVLGYASQADVMLKRNDGARRLWIEFEISRADPVANHAKFATSNLFRPLPKGSVFISMVTPHVARGRRNLAAATIHLMRRLGIEAYQTLLFPHHTPADIRELNEMNPAELRNAGLRIKPELTRAMTICEPVFSTEAVRVHYAGELLEVMLSVRRFNVDLQTDAGLAQWGRRPIRFFVYDPKSGDFAPSKFCGYLPVLTRFDEGCGPRDVLASREMTVELYTRIERTAERFDGNLAWKRLKRHLGMRIVLPHQLPEIAERFGIWLERKRECIDLDKRGPVFLLPPTWFT